MRGVITMLPALSPTETRSGSDGKSSASPDSRIQWARYSASPPLTSRASASRTQETPLAFSMLGSAVSSSPPTDFHPSPVMGRGDRPLMNRHGPPGSASGAPYPAVGMHRALDSAIGLPRRSTNASWVRAVFAPGGGGGELIMFF